MTIQFNDLSGKAAADGAVTPAEMADLRKSAWQDGRMTSVEIDTMILANDQLRGSSEDWSEFFSGALCEYALSGSEPKGCVDEARARWIISRITEQGVLAGVEELEAVVRILERAARVGDSLRDLAIGAIEKAVLDGAGPTRTGGGAAPAGCITNLESDFLRRILDAMVGADPSAAKAGTDLLFRIKDATLNGDNAEEWPGVFVEFVAGYLQGFGGAEPLSAERAAELEAFMNGHGANLARFFGSIRHADADEGVGNLPGEALDADSELDGLERSLLRALSVQEG